MSRNRKNCSLDFDLETFTKQEKKSAAAAPPQSLLEAIEAVVTLAYRSELQPSFFEEASVPLKYMQGVLSLTPMQCALLSIFVDNSDDFSIHLSEIASFLGCSTTRMLLLSHDVDELVRRRYIRCRRNDDNERLSYRVPREVILALKQNQPYLPVKRKPLNPVEWFDMLGKIFSEAERDELDYASLCADIATLLEDGGELLPVQRLNGYGIMHDENIVVFLRMAYCFVTNQDDRIGYRDFDDIFDGSEIPSWLRHDFSCQRGELFELGLIENSFDDGFRDPSHFKLTDRAKEELLSELPVMRSRKRDHSQDLLCGDSFAERKLVYNPQEQRLVDELASILSPERFAQVQQRMADAGLRKGFCCLFYGAPGTGKTETVQQLARLLHRDVMRVDVDRIKSCWVGESEKNIKKVFVNYREAVQNMKSTPILLFNEADAVLGVRMEGASRSVDKMENSIQNIILQEMETLEGIMIATTNLTTNLDKAFERRFLYKVEFHKPTAEARAQIWRQMLPELSEADATLLAREFDFSGGEIENIVRRNTVNQILSGEPLSGELLRRLCLEERIATKRSRLGF